MRALHFCPMQTMAMAAASPTGFAAHISAGLTERIQAIPSQFAPARLATSSSSFTSPIHCFSSLSSRSVSDSQQCIPSPNSKAFFPSSASQRASGFSYFEVLASMLSERSLRKGRKRRSVKKMDKVTVYESQRLTAIRASQGDTAGNNHVQFSAESGSQDETLRRNHVPLYVMLPLDTVTMLNTLKRVKALQAGLRALKIIGVDGVMMHVWWGVVEGEGPKSYDWSAYLALVKMINSAGLKVQASMCFHGCSKVGDSYIISLPPWILSFGNSNPDIFYTDRGGNRFKDCLSLGVDYFPLLGGRSPMQMYKEFLESFRETFGLYLGNTIVEVIMGLGPDGELRYPAYQEATGRWRFPGVGEFQCYDKYMLESLRKHAAAQGNPEWGLGGPNDAPSYNQWPNDAGFFHEQHGSWNTPSGQLFLSWYSGELLAHGDRMLSLLSSVFRKDRVVVVGKVPGVHWWYKSKPHAAELTAGYYNIEGRDGYDEVAKMFMKNAAMMILPCMEMSDKEQPSEARCSPELLLLQIRKACSKYGVPVAGQNSLPRFDDVGYTRIKNSVHRFDYPYIPRLAVFTFLRMGESLFYSEHWRLFVNFVRNMDKDVVWRDDNDGPPAGGQNRIFKSSCLNRQEARFQVQY